MIDINITIIVQIIHFLIAYALLRKFLWRPVLVRLDEHARQQESLDHELRQQTQKSLNKEEQIAHVWQEARQSFAVHIPTFKRAISRSPFLIAAPLTPTISPAHIEKLTAFIIEKARQ